jgi:hypothetical protein
VKITRTTMNSKAKIEAVISRPNRLSPVHSSHSQRIEVRGVAVERPCPDVIEDHEDREEHERRRPDRREQVREVVRRERQEEVLPRR